MSEAHTRGGGGDTEEEEVTSSWRDQGELPRRRENLIQVLNVV